jgi:peptidoglycan LD-endopeptidase LytH
MGGGSPSFVMVLTSDSVNDAVDRWEFASSVAQSDRDLAIDVAFQTEQIRRERERLGDAVARQAAAAASLGAQRDALSAAVSNLADAVAGLQDKLAVEQAAVTGGPYPVTGSGAISTCPVAGPNAFVDSFGDPRPGGRTHQGIDMIAPYGTPVVAVHAGTVELAPNTLGGNAVVLYHDGSADSTYYAHLSSYGATGHVSAGTAIGYVGSTGDTSVNHLHFEYHPGGGAAVDPYRLLLAVC